MYFIPNNIRINNNCEDYILYIYRACVSLVTSTSRTKQAFISHVVGRCKLVADWPPYDV